MIGNSVNSRSSSMSLRSFMCGSLTDDTSSS
jgi:hypothetical protein